MFEVLMFLFENYMNDNVVLPADSDTIIDELERVGFDRYEISRALDWLDGLCEFQSAFALNKPITPHAFRCYSPLESHQLNTEGVGLLMQLEQLGIIDPATRETVIDRLMALDSGEINLGRIKWVVLMALFNQPDKKIALSLLQDMILADAFGRLH